MAQFLEFSTATEREREKEKEREREREKEREIERDRKNHVDVFSTEKRVKIAHLHSYKMIIHAHTTVSTYVCE